MTSATHEGRTEDRVAIIAGNGLLPVHVAETLAAAGRRPFIVAIEGEADLKLLRNYEHEMIYPAHIGRLIAILKRVGPADVTMIGGVRKRPSLLRLIPDWTTIRLIGRLVPKLRSGDDALLRGVVDAIEEAGFTVRGAHELVPDLLAEAGLIAGPAPSRADKEAIATGIDGARALGMLDAGQACVAIGRRVVAMEGAEGTDLMLERIAMLRGAGRLPKRKGGALVKLAKPIQDKRIDLPAIGVSTIENVAAAGLRGVAVHAGRSLIADHAATCSKADELGVFIVGVDPPEAGAAGTPA